MTTSSSAILPTPQLRWTYQLPNSGKISSDGLLRKGNAVVSTQDGRYVYVTTNDGILHILSLRNGENHAAATSTSSNERMDETGMGGVDIVATKAFEPVPLPNRHIDCRSGVSLHETKDGVQFAVYAITDVPIVQNRPMSYNYQTAEMTFGGSSASTNSGSIGEDGALRSRVIAVNPDGSLRWQVSLAGYVTGTPLIGQADSDKIYVSQNVPDDASTNSLFDPDFYRGRIVVVRDNNAGQGEGGVEITASKEGSLSVPYGPLTLQTVQIRGKERDVVFFAEDRGEGHVMAGGIYVLSPTEFYDLRVGRGNGAYELRTLSRWLRSSVVRPVVSDDGDNLWVGGVGSRLASLSLGTFITSVGLQDMIEPEWEAVLGGTNRNDTEPLGGAGVLSDDASSIFVAGASTDFFRLDAATGQIKWTDRTGESVFFAEPKLGSSSSSVLYAIEHSDGRVIAYNSETGARLWRFDCKDLSGIETCQDSVEGEFAITSSGNLLLYGDIFGRIVGVQIATLSLDSALIMPNSQPTAVQPTLSKEASPTMSVPTTAPVTDPVLATGSMTEAQTSNENESTGAINVAGIAAGVTVGAIVLALAIFWFVFSHHRKKATKEEDSLDAPPSFAEVVDSTCYLKRSSEREADVSWVSARDSDKSISSLARSFHSEHSDIEVLVTDSSAQDNESEILATILQRDSAESEGALPPPPPAATDTNNSSDDTGQRSSMAIDDLSTRISSFTSSLSRTLSETNLTSLESSVLPYLSFGLGAADDEAGKREGSTTSAKAHGASVVSFHNSGGRG